MMARALRARAKASSSSCCWSSLIGFSLAAMGALHSWLIVPAFQEVEEILYELVRTVKATPGRGPDAAGDQNRNTKPRWTPRIALPLTSSGAVNGLVRPAEPLGRNPALGEFRNRSAIR